MLDSLLELGSAFDWLSPLVAMVRDRVDGPEHTFLIPRACGWSAYEIRSLLRRYGVRTWGLMVISGTIMVSVPLAQARWAQYLLWRAGIPTENGLPQSATRRRTTRSQRRRRGRRRGPLHALWRAVGEWLAW